MPAKHKAPARFASSRRWSDWWNSARPTVQRSPWVEMSATKQPTFALRRVPLSHEDRIREEVEGADAQLFERTGRRPGSFAYPFGRLGSAAVKVARERYQLACTTELGATRVSPFFFGNTRSNFDTTSMIGRSRCNAMPSTNQITLSAGNRRRLSVAVPVAAA